MHEDHTARVSTTIDAPADAVWQALVTPATIEKYMFGAKVQSDFRAGSPITWKGEWKGKPYEDKGVIRRIEPGRLLEYDHYSPLSGPDKPENHHCVRIELGEQGDRTTVSLSQDNNAGEEALAESEKNWRAMLEGLKKVVET
jgi:uncharacterized protein YndB with AHSA1/START domain